MWVATQKLPRSPGHPFYERLNQVLEKAGFDAFVEGRCERFYAERVGRPSLRPGRYFRMLLVGYFEGLNSERAIAWRVADSMSLRAFLDLGPEETPPNHSTLSRTRRRIRGRRKRRLQRQRSELVERPFAHQFTTGGLRRIFVRGHANVRKRLLIHVCGFNLGLLVRHLTGVGTPRSLQGRVQAHHFAPIGAKKGRWIGWNRLWKRFWASIRLDLRYWASRTH